MWFGYNHWFYSLIYQLITKIMARFKGTLPIVGSLKGLSLYTMRGRDEVIVRTKGGPSKHTVKTSESCHAMRLNGREWGGCTKAASGIRLALGGLTRLADYNLNGDLNALCKKMQVLGGEGPKGTRPVLISRYGSLLTGFSLNRKSPFDSVVRVPLRWEIDRATASARIELPAFEPASHLLSPFRLPLMRWVAVLGAVTDVAVDVELYRPVNELVRGQGAEVCTEWQPVKSNQPARTISIEVSALAPHLTASDSLMLSIGVEFGTVGADGGGEAVKWAGCAKVLLINN